MTPAFLRPFRIFGLILIFGASAGLLYSFSTESPTLLDLAVSVTYGVLIAAPLGLFQLAANLSDMRIWLRGLPFLTMLVIRSAWLAAVILPIQYFAVGHWIWGVPRPTDPGRFWAVTTYSVGASFLLNFVFQIAILVGPRTLLDLMRGAYHKPREEKRFVLFVDVVGSTAAAERLGNLGVHAYLERIFRLASGPVTDSLGEIHAYVGDEMIVTWLGRHGAIAARPLACFLAMRRVLADAAPRFLAEFGVAPTIRGSLHYGIVVAGEIGAAKRSIVFHGDVMNTAARLEEASRAVEGGFIASRAAIDALEAGALPKLAPLGALHLRGRQEPIEGYALAA